MRILLTALIITTLAGCSSFHRGSLVTSLGTGYMAVNETEVDGADYEVVIMSLWGNGVDSDDPVERQVFVADLLEIRGKCLDGYDVNYETKELFMKVEGGVGRQEYYKYFVYVACKVG
jgi:hypothetical protein